MAAPADSAAELHEKLHAGAYQFDSALDGLQDSRAAINSILSGQGGATKEALLNVLDMLDSAGDTLAEYNVAPEVDEVRKDQAAAEKRRQASITDANDALAEIKDARGALTDMLASDPPEKEKAALQKADDATSEAVSAIGDGIRLLGGTVSAEDPTSDAASKTEPIADSKGG